MSVWTNVDGRDAPNLIFPSHDLLVNENLRLLETAIAAVNNASRCL